VAITEDASSPAFVSTGGAQTITTAAFNPPASSLYIALVSFNGFTTGAVTSAVTDSALNTWTLLCRANSFAAATLSGGAEVWCFFSAGSRSSFTVTATTSGAASKNGVAMGVKVLQGASATQNGATQIGHGQSTLPSISLTTTVTASRPYGALIDSSDHNVMTAGANTTIMNQFNDTTTFCTYVAYRSSAATGTPGATTFANSAGTPDWNMAWAEILPTGAAASGPNPQSMSQYAGFI
jgi:hypothetical protein